MVELPAAAAAPSPRRPQNHGRWLLSLALLLAASALPACRDEKPAATLTVGDPTGGGPDSQLAADALEGSDTQNSNDSTEFEDAPLDTARRVPDADPSADALPGDDALAEDAGSDDALIGDAAAEDTQSGDGEADSDTSIPPDTVPPPDSQPFDVAPDTADVPFSGCKTDTDCNDDNVCTSDTCLVSGNCTWLATPGPCSDGNACTLGEKCQGGKCTGGVSQDDQTACGDGNVCTVETCDAASGCVSVPAAGPCSDGNKCTTGDACVGGTCQAGSPIVCDDANPCTADSCDPTSGGCVSQVQSGTCSDGNPCTVGDACQGVACLAGPVKSCDDGNGCTGDACNPQTGACSNSPTPGVCDDGNACTSGDVCTGGTCKGGAVKVCDDGNPCTADTCQGGNCTATALADGSTCGAQMVCKAGSCSAPAPTAAASCQALKGVGSGVQTLDVDGNGPLAPAQTYCEMSLSGGGWTLVAVVSDDSVSTFTMAAKDLWGNSQAQVGSVAALNKDFRSPLLATLPAKEVLFQHSSGVWAQYTFGDGKSSLGATVVKVGGPICYGMGKGLNMTAGTLPKVGKLCETMLYLNPADHDGYQSCSVDGTPEHTWGPAWNVNREYGCFDDPGWGGSLGPVASEPYVEGGTAQGHPVGFGWAIGVNVGAAGTGANWMRVYAR